MSLDRPTYRCGSWARWLPRVLGGAVLAAAWIASTRPEASGPGAPAFVRMLVVGAGAVMALWLVRRGGILRRHVRVDEAGLTVGAGARERTLEYRDMTTIQVRFPLEGGLQWVPTVAVFDVYEQAWEVPTVLVDGPAWLDALLERAGRDDLREWASARGIRRTLARSGWFVPTGYALAVVLVLGAIGMHLR